MATPALARASALLFVSTLLVPPGELAGQAGSRGGSIFWLPEPVGRLQAGAEAAGALSSADFRLPNDAFMDVWELEGRAGESMTVDMRSDDFDAYLYLVGPGLASTLADDDGAGGCHARITVRFLETGTFRVIATSAMSERTGVYSLRAATDPEPPSQARCGGPDPETFLQLPTADRRIAAGESRPGTLSTSDLRLNHGPFVQAWAFEATAGQAITVTLESDAFDAYLYMIGPGLELLSDDDGAGDLDSRIRVTLPMAGTYRIVASSLSSGDTGPYRLTVSSP